MSAPTTTAPVIRTRDEFVAHWADPARISDFARTVIGADLIAEAVAGDYLAVEVLADQVADLARLEALSDDALQAELDSTLRIDGWNEAEGKFEVNDIGWRDHWVGVIWSLQAHRAQLAAEAEWTATPDAHLTHRPFAALAAI